MNIKPKVPHEMTKKSFLLIEISGYNTVQFVHESLAVFESDLQWRCSIILRVMLLQWNVGERRRTKSLLLLQHRRIESDLGPLLPILLLKIPKILLIFQSINSSPDVFKMKYVECSNVSNKSTVCNNSTGWQISQKE